MKTLVPHGLKLKRLGIDTHEEAVVYMRADCKVCRSEGLNNHSRVEISLGDHHIIATLNVVFDGIVGPDEAGLSEVAWRKLNPQEGSVAFFSHPQPVTSMKAVRSKLYGHPMTEKDFEDVIYDIVLGKYTDIQVAAFVASCAAGRLNQDEITGLTRAMIKAGEQIHWDSSVIVDKHSVGGLPANRTTPIVVSIVAAAGLIMPKTSSRAITSPAGTADTMATLTKVDLSLASIKNVVQQEGGCLVWGGSVSLSPADDMLIKIERALDIDSEGQMVASILSKKAAAGVTHVVIDMPVGPTAKVRSELDALMLKKYLEQTGEAIGLKVCVVISEGLQPVGRGIGPALEARDVLAVLKNEPRAPEDLKRKALILAAHVMVLAGLGDLEEMMRKAREILENGSALKKFLSICEAQGGLRFPQEAPFKRDVLSYKAGMVTSIDNRKLAMAAKLAGAPEAVTAGLDLKSFLQSSVQKDDVLFTLHAETHGELDYAFRYVEEQKDIILIT